MTPSTESVPSAGRTRRRRLAPLAGSLLATGVLAVPAVLSHPQGDIARLIPYVLAGIGVWVLFAAATGGRRAAAATACGLGALGLLGVAAVAFFVAPIPTGECRSLFLEWNTPYCRADGPIALVVASAAGSIASAVWCLWMSLAGRRTPNHAHA